MNGEVIKYIIIIVIILALFFLSQQSYFSFIGKNPYVRELAKQISSYWEKITDWSKKNIYPNLSKEAIEKEVLERGGVAKEEIEKQKKKIEKSAWLQTKKFVAEKVLTVLGVEPQEILPEGLQCQPTE